MITNRQLEYEIHAPSGVGDGWHVETVDYQSEGELYVAVFYGSLAKERAEEYATWKSRGQ